MLTGELLAVVEAGLPVSSKLVALGACKKRSSTFRKRSPAAAC